MKWKFPFFRQVVLSQVPLDKPLKTDHLWLPPLLPLAQMTELFSLQAPLFEMWPAKIHLRPLLTWPLWANRTTFVHTNWGPHPSSATSFNSVHFVKIWGVQRQWLHRGQVMMQSGYFTVLVLVKFCLKQGQSVHYVDARVQPKAQRNSSWFWRQNSELEDPQLAWRCLLQSPFFLRPCPKSQDCTCVCLVMNSAFFPHSICLCSRTTMRCAH